MSALPGRGVPAAPSELRTPRVARPFSITSRPCDWRVSTEIEPVTDQPASYLACALFETIDSELRLLALVRVTCRRSFGVEPDISLIDALLDERLRTSGLPRVQLTRGV